MSKAIFKKVSELLNQGKSFALLTVVSVKGSTPRESGAKMIVYPDGSTEGTIGGGALESKAIEDAKRMFNEGQRTSLLHYKLVEEKHGGIGAVCGGESDVFIEVFEKPWKVLVMGGGHVGEAVAKVAQLSGFEVVVTEGREELAKNERFGGAKLLKCSPSNPDILKEIDSKTAVVVVTHSHNLDLEVLRLVVGSNAFYIGAIGSKRKIASIFSILEKEGISKEMLDRIYAPVGIDIGAETPAEIAISIIAEIISVCREKVPNPASMKYLMKAKE